LNPKPLSTIAAPYMKSFTWNSTTLDSGRGVKAYFNARLIDDGEVLLIDASTAVPPPPW